MPRTWRLRPFDIGALLVGNGLFIVAMWWRHGGLDQLATPGGFFTASGQLTALLGTYLALVQLVLMSRSPWLDQLFGMHRLAAWHRWVGFSVVWLLLGHGVLTTVGYATFDQTSPLGELWTMLTTYPYVLMGTVGMAMLLAVGVTSVRLARRRLAYETWHGIHLYAYLAIALATAHQLVVGSD
jgi:Predicted ferric reductase